MNHVHAHLKHSSFLNTNFCVEKASFKHPTPEMMHTDKLNSLSKKKGKCSFDYIRKNDRLNNHLTRITRISHRGLQYQSVAESLFGLSHEMLKAGVMALIFSSWGSQRELKTEELKSSAHRAKNVVGGQRSWTDKSLSTKYVHIKPMITQRESIQK